MLKLIKRLVGIEPEKASPPVRPARRPQRRGPSFRDMSGPAPLPEVHEGNDHADWQLWKDSVDSQMSGFEHSQQNYEDTVPSSLDELDPFERVKNRDS